MINMPLLSQGDHDSFIWKIGEKKRINLNERSGRVHAIRSHTETTLTVDRHMAGSADRNAHLVVALDTVEVLLDLACVRVQFQAAAGAVEVIWMIWLVLVFQRFRIVDDRLAFETDILSKGLGLQPVIAVVTDRSIAILDEALVGQRNVAQFAGEAHRMPTGVQRLDHAADYELFTLFTGRGVKHVEIVLAVLSTLELVEDLVVPETTEAL